jgi:hypothetical protein
MASLFFKVLRCKAGTFLSLSEQTTYKVNQFLEFNDYNAFNQYNQMNRKQADLGSNRSCYRAFFPEK